MSDATCTDRSSDDRSVRYYDRNASEYAAATLGVDMSAIYDRFLKRIPLPARILDAGCGSGRDVLAFLERGYSVDAFDASSTLCELATRLTGVPVQALRFQDLDVEARYEGIWACASLLHVPQTELGGVLERLIAALKPGGTIYASFKEGAKERHAPDGRLFLDMSKDRLRAHFAEYPDMTIAELWMSEGEGSHKGLAEWLNVIATKAPNDVSHGA